MAQIDITNKLDQLRKEYVFADTQEQNRIKELASVLKSIRIACYLPGCINAADSELTAFCCKEHKDEYNKDIPQPEVKPKLSIEEMQKRLLEIAHERSLKP